MAGSVKRLKQYEILFEAGDKAETMYIIRLGSLRVFFRKGEEEVALADLKPGAIVGEMAFFDDGPRSASVKALEESELLEISKLDFQKLLKQIPPWFVTIMQSLVSRLRASNEKIAKLEATHSSGNQSFMRKGEQFPLQHVIQAFMIISNMLEHSEKQGHFWVLPKSVLLESFYIYSLNEEFLDSLIQVFEDSSLASLKFTAGSPCLMVSQRGILTGFCDFLVKSAPYFTISEPGFSKSTFFVMDTLQASAEGAIYDPMTFSLKETLSILQKKGIEISLNNRLIQELKLLKSFQLTKSTHDVSIKVQLADLKKMSQYMHLFELIIKKHLM